MNARPTVALAALIAFGCSGNGSPPAEAAPELIVARVNGRPITLTDFGAKWSTLPDPIKQIYAGEAGKRDFLDELISRELLLQEARRSGLESDAQIVEQTQLYRERLLLDRLIKREIDARVDVTPEDMLRFFDANRDRLPPYTDVRASHILLKTEAEARALRRQLVRGANFGDLARRHSIDPATRERGGDLGLVRKDKLIPEFAGAIAGLRDGQISDVVKTSYGYHVIRLVDQRTVIPQTLTEVRDEVRERVARDKEKQLFDEWVKRLRAEAKITISDNLLATVDAPAAAASETAPAAAE